MDSGRSEGGGVWHQWHGQEPSRVVVPGISSPKRFAQVTMRLILFTLLGRLQECIARKQVCNVSYHLLVLRYWENVLKMHSSAMGIVKTEMLVDHTTDRRRLHAVSTTKLLNINHHDTVRISIREYVRMCVHAFSAAPGECGAKHQRGLVEPGGSVGMRVDDCEEEEEEGLGLAHVPRPGRRVRRPCAGRRGSSWRRSWGGPGSGSWRPPRGSAPGRTPPSPSCEQAPEGGFH